MIILYYHWVFDSQCSWYGCKDIYIYILLKTSFQDPMANSFPAFSHGQGAVKVVVVVVLVDVVVVLVLVLVTSSKRFPWGFNIQIDRS